MNHVGPPQPSGHAARSSVTGSTMSLRDSHQQRHVEHGDRSSLQWSADGSAADNASWSEVDGERLQDAAAPPVNDGIAEKPADASQMTDEQPRLTARQSLRLRRHFDCPDLVIINRNPSAEDVATACTARADPAPPAQPQRQPLPTLSSSSSSAPTFAPRLPRRRLTLPGIIKYDPADHRLLRRRRSRSSTPSEPLPAEYLTVNTPSATTTTGSVSAVDAGFGVRGGRPAAAMYLVENCARKRLQEEQISEAEAAVATEGQHATAAATLFDDAPTLDGLDPPKPLTMRYR